MKSMKPIARLLLITASVLTLGVLCVFGLRLVAQSSPPQLAQLPTEPRGPLVFALGNLNFDSKPSLQAYLSTIAYGNAVVPAIEVRATTDHKWVVFDSRYPERAEDLLTLEEFLKTISPERLMVIVQSREVAAAASLLEVLGERPPPSVTYILSPFHRLNRELRKRRPLWHFGADSGTITQWHVFAAVGLEPMVSTDFDWLLRGGHLGLAAKFSPRVEAQLDDRRIGEIQVLDSPDEPLRPDIYGVLTNRPTIALERLGLLPPPEN